MRRTELIPGLILTAMLLCPCPRTRTTEVLPVQDENGDRFALIDGELLLRLMKCPDRGGRVHTARSLAQATGISKSKIHSMTRDQSTRPLTGEQAAALAEAVHVRRKAIFTPIVSVFADTDSNEGTP